MAAFLFKAIINDRSKPGHLKQAIKKNHKNSTNPLKKIIP
jgi:hypothetical protein